MKSQPVHFDVKKFPTFSLGSTSPLYRLYKHTRKGDATQSGWYFSSKGNPRSGRFDLPVPHGTCYFSTEKFGAWTETFRGAAIVNSADVDCRTLLSAICKSEINLASMTDRRAAKFGVNMDLFTGDDYHRPQEWAQAFFTAKFEGLIALLRHDPSARARNVGIFGKTGAVARLTGWQTSRTSPSMDAGLLQDLREVGLSVLDVPNHVAITPFTE
ncbi:MAG: RES family NAD+ phosphorylase [Actinobacteria bacterium]|nr:RES family NAD+ phosphorylase [Actinomycetota bacterium]